MATTIAPYTADAVTRLTKRIDASRMAKWLQMSVTENDDALHYKLTFAEAHIGNPVIRTLHGGVVSSFLETCAYLDLHARLDDSTRLRTTSVHTSYFRSSKAVDMYADVTVQRLGRRFAFVEVTGWQEEPENIVSRSAIGIRVIREET